MKQFYFEDVVNNTKLKKITPQGQLDSVWYFGLEDEARLEIKKLGYIEPLRNRFVIVDKYKPPYLKLMELQ